MNASLVCFVAMLSAAPATDDWQPIYASSSEVFEAAIRGQNPPYEEAPPQNGQQAPPNTYATPPANGFVTPLQPAAPPTYAPFLSQPPGMVPYGRPRPFAYSYGANGPQPYRFGWTYRYDVAILPRESTERSLGDMGIFEVNAEWEHTKPGFFGEILSFTQQFNLRQWDGPNSTPTFGLPGKVYRFGWDIELATPANGPWSIQLAFNPSINSDFQNSLTSDAWNFDSRGILFYRATPQWMYAFGAGFWDRVHNYVIPYAGVVWTPDDRWEWRILFPQPRVSYFLGNVWGFASWLYASGEFHVEAYEVDLEPIGLRERVEISDWRILTGLRTDNGWFSGFVEAGWVFDREVDFEGPAPDFDISSGFIARLGLRF